ncbi:MAG: hypothetical protein HPY84_01955 [Syntrophobacteraceae bacterium]|nr:hypothetical protein [Syntrophobacteraceae bacterium]
MCRCPTCMAFAAKVFRREASIASCLPLDRTTENCKKLQRELLADGNVES